ncbi:MAG: YgdI/YgdR family lipoprotein [Oscillospiraceae bacterium]|nr:YgdI/YgdR family lipoprotein [Oscillospiraceae bacterium]
MKKIVSILLAAGMVFALAACSSNEGSAEEVPEATATPTAAELQAASESDAAALAEASQASSTDAAAETEPEAWDESAYETAQEYIGLTVEELYAAIGEPTETQYAASCLQENAEDGMLFYDGFYIWSLRTEDSEIVYQVYLND